MTRHRLFVFLFCVVVLTVCFGCETIKGVSRDTANTVGNIKDILVSGKTIKDVLDW